MGKVYQLRPGTCMPAPSLLRNCASVFAAPAWNEVREEVRQVGLQDVGVELARRVLVEAMEQEANELTGGPKGRLIPTHVGVTRLRLRNVAARLPDPHARGGDPPL